MTRIGPYDNGDNSHSYPGTLNLTGTVQTVSIDCYAERRRLGKKSYLFHGGSRNVAIRDGRLAILGNGHVKMLDVESLHELRQIPTVVRRGCPGWFQYALTDRSGKPGGLQGHSVAAGLSTLYWLESDVIAVTPGGDIGSTATGRDWVRVSGDAPLPSIARDSNQHEYLGVCDGNKTILYALPGHGFGRMTQGVIGGMCKIPAMLNNPCYLSTPACHYTFAPLQLNPIESTGFLRHGSGLQIFQVDGPGKARQVFADKSLGIPYGEDGAHHPQPWCLWNDQIVFWSTSGEIVWVDVNKWSITKRMPAPTAHQTGRLAVNSKGEAVVFRLAKLYLAGRWSAICPYAFESGSSNAQFVNHLAVDDQHAYFASVVATSLVIGQHRLTDGARVNEVKVPIPGAGPTAQCVDFCINGGALFAVLTRCDPSPDNATKFQQILVRVS